LKFLIKCFNFYDSIIFYLVFQFCTSVGSLFYKFFCGLDGVSLFLTIFTTFLFFIVIFGTFDNINFYFLFYLIFFFYVEFSVLGSFIFFDLFGFIFFFEIQLFPMFFIISLFGSSARCKYAALLFFFFSGIGASLLLYFFLIFFGDFGLSGTLLLIRNFFFNYSYFSNKYF
jgi:NADH:ubiquinone oxidoreductase subunit 4 (subunit M)